MYEVDFSGKRKHGGNASVDGVVYHTSSSLSLPSVKTTGLHTYSVVSASYVTHTPDPVSTVPHTIQGYSVVLVVLDKILLTVRTETTL